MPGAGSTYSDPELSWQLTSSPTGLVFPVGSNLGARLRRQAARRSDFNNATLYAIPARCGAQRLRLLGLPRSQRTSSPTTTPRRTSCGSATASAATSAASSISSSDRKERLRRLDRRQRLPHHRTGSWTGPRTGSRTRRVAAPAPAGSRAISGAISARPRRTHSIPRRSRGPMHPPSSSRLERTFAAIVRARWLFVALYALLLPPSVYYAIGVEQDNSIDRLIVPSDPDFVATREFEAGVRRGRVRAAARRGGRPARARGDRARRRDRARARRRSRTSRRTRRSRSSGARGRLRADAREGGRLPRVRRAAPICSEAGARRRRATSRSGSSLEVDGTAERSAGARRRSTPRSPSADAAARRRCASSRRSAQPYVNAYLDETQRGAIDILRAVRGLRRRPEPLPLPLVAHAARVPRHARRLPRVLGRATSGSPAACSRSCRRWCR